MNTRNARPAKPYPVMWKKNTAATIMQMTPKLGAWLTACMRIKNVGKRAIPKAAEKMIRHPASRKKLTIAVNNVASGKEFAYAHQADKPHSREDQNYGKKIQAAYLYGKDHDGSDRHEAHQIQRKNPIKGRGADYYTIQTQQ